MNHPGTIKHNPIHIRRIPIAKLYDRIRDKRSLSGLDTDVMLFVKIRVIPRVMLDLFVIHSSTLRNDKLFCPHTEPEEIQQYNQYEQYAQKSFIHYLPPNFII